MIFQEEGGDFDLMVDELGTISDQRDLVMKSLNNTRVKFLVRSL